MNKFADYAGNDCTKINRNQLFFFSFASAVVSVCGIDSSRLLHYQRNKNQQQQQQQQICVNIMHIKVKNAT